MRWLPTRTFWRGPWPWLAAAALLCGWFALRSDRHPEVITDPRPPGGVQDLLALSQRKDVNVLFILVDTLRASHLHVYGYPRPTSPLFDAIASQGILFARHLSQSSWTKSSMASLWTGLYPARSGVTRFDDRLASEAVHAAEIFRDAGFTTAGLWRNGWVEGYFGFDQGFEVYVRPTTRGAPAEIQRKNPTIHVGGTDLDLVEGAREFLRVHGRDRWFLYLHLMDVHEFVYDETTAVFGSGNADIYDNAILRTNQVLDLLFSVLYETGHLDDTLVVIGSDHGEAFGERGIEGHARNVYPETTEVPLMISLPFRLAPPAVVRQRTANVDLWPTVLDLLGLPPLEGVDGRSRVPEILAAARGEPAPADETIAIAHLDQTWGQRVETTAPNVSVSRGSLRYLLFRSAGAIREQLFDARRDPREREERLADEPEAAKEMRTVAERYLQSEPPWGARAPTLDIDEIQLNQLRALGYAVP